jgi:glutamate/tyrosine decarboxylase-like PLP-dependent enzyme
MILPESAHVAFEKAAEYFGVKAVHAPLDADYRADMRAVKKLINRNTILLVASTPSYPHGVVDPIEELGRLAQRHHLPLHVDGCLGGFLLPFVERLGHDVPPFDFRVPGVCSMSADVHKYGYAAKGASVLMYRNMKHFKHQFFLYENWPGGIFLSPGLLGTRPGGPIGAAWAALQAMGENGYLRHARTVMQTTKRLQAGVNAVPGLAVVGRPHMSVFAYRSTDPAVNILAVGDQMEKRGWHIDRQQKPDSLHAMVTPRHAAVVDDYLRDLRASVDYVRAHPEAALEAGAALYGMAFSVPFRSLVKNDLLKTAMKMYGPECEIPSLGEDGASDDPLKKVGLLFLQAKNRLAGWWDKKKP